MHTNFSPLFRRPAAIAVAIAGLLFVAAPAFAQTPQVKYERALAREQAARKADSPNLATLRAIAATYETIPRQHPRSGYSDNALWQAAGLLQLAWESGNNARDRERAVALLQWLRREYPSSSLVRQINGRLTALNRTRPATATARAQAPPAASRNTETHRPSGEAAVVDPAPLAPTRVPAPAPQPGPSIAVRGISHATLPRGDRLTIELSAEAAYTAERREAPDELTLTLAGASAASAIVNAATTIRGGMIQSMQIGNGADGLQIVVRLAGRPRHSAFPLYGPHRLVFDFEADEATPPPDRSATAPDVVQPVAERRPQEPSKPVPQPLPIASRSAPGPEPDVVREPSAPVPAAPAAAPAVAAATTGAAPISSDEPTPAPPVVPEATTVARVERTAPTPAIESEVDLDVTDAEEAEENDAPSAPTARPVPPANTTGSGAYSLARQLGLGVSRIVIDPGHGGSDPGAQANDVTEAALVLDVALRLEKLLKAEPGFEVVLTRRTNRAISLARRTAIANEQAADLFLSIHANSSPRTETAGVETYYLNFSSNQHAAAVAARENASSSEDMHLLPELVRAIATNNKLAESRELAGMVQSSLVRHLKSRNKSFQDLGVKQAPFMVLIGAQMPSVLAEVAFVSNRAEASLLKQQAYKQQIAQALFDAILKYRGSLKRITTVTASAEGR